MKLLKQDKYNMHYYVSGDKGRETIVFLHAAFSDHTCFDGQRDFFARDFYVITVDLLGHGLSKPGKAKDKIDKSVEHIFEILKQEGISSAHIVGVSMGSLIAQYFALKYPSQTLSLTALGGYNINHINKEINRSQRKEIVKWVFKIIFSMDAFRRYVSSVSAIYPESRQRIYASSKGFTRKSLIVMSGMGNIIAEREKTPRPYPLLILVGEKDIEPAKEASRQWHEEEPESDFQIIENAGHLANMDNPELFNKILSNSILKR